MVRLEPRKEINKIMSDVESERTAALVEKSLLGRF